MRSVNRREFNGLFVALGSCMASSGASTLDAATAASTSGERTVKFRDGTVVPALGQGSWHLGQGRHPAAEEEDALRTGLSLGMTLIDTSGNYGEGRSEELIKGVIAGQRDLAFVVSKVEADQVTGNAMARACDGSLARLGTDKIDRFASPSTRVFGLFPCCQVATVTTTLVSPAKDSSARSSCPCRASRRGRRCRGPKLP